MANRRRSNRIWFVMLGVFVAVFLFTFLAQKFKNDNEVGAANMAAFDPGYIISDYQMGNYNSMNEAQIQGFLNAKGRCGNTNFNGVGTRVGHFSDSTPPTTWHVVNGHTVCLAEENMNGESAAHIIWQAAQDYRINPQVLIVLLQKETGLITDPIPNSWDYQRATGYGCPDTAACSSKYYGFKNQVRNAAWLFRYTLDNGYSRYPIGNVYVQWNPNAGCGGSVVNIKNNATAALYRYTPYQPNAAALSSSYGYGDGCSAYGNRNFYSYFEDWFGGIKTSEAASRGRTIEDGVYQFVSVADSSEAINIEGEINSGVTSRETNIGGRDTREMRSQVFEVKYDERNGYYSIVNSATGLALDVEGASLSNNAQILMWSQHDGCNQDWVIAPSGNEEYTIVSRCSSKVLDATAVNDLVTYESHGGSNQRWILGKIAKSEGRTIEDGVYQLISAADYGEAIDIEGGVRAGMVNGRTIMFKRKTKDMDNQVFEIKYDEGSGYYSIVNPTTGLAFDVEGANVKNNSSILMWSQHDGCNQDWAIRDNGDEKYTIMSRCSSKVLDATSTNKLVSYGSHGGNNQKWYLGKIAESKGRTIEDGIYQFAPKSNLNKVIDIEGGVFVGMNSGNPIIYDRRAKQIENQVFEVKYNGDEGYYTIANPTSGLVLDVSGSGVVNGVPVLVWSPHGNCNQDWVLEPDDEGYYIVISRCSSKVLDATAENKLITYGRHGGVNQRWQLIDEEK